MHYSAPDTCMGKATDEAILRSHNTAKAKRREQKIVAWDEDAEVKAKQEREQWRFDCEGFLVNVMPKSFPLAFSPSHKETKPTRRITSLSPSKPNFG
jgi:hypothetical protein